MILRFATLALLVGGSASALLVAWGDRLGETALRGALLGAGLATAGAIAGMALFAWSLPRRTGQFVGALLLGFLGRLVVFGAALIVVGLRARGFDLAALAVSLLGFYGVFQILEVRFVLKGLRQKRS
ncbi:MAG: hypothetical protein AUI47_04760 [Acidobacteria bacterium 13_1_40CM_2_68_5]|nr:MAG: hypothetical protein AUI47_04760 [Acidobacteria bacterium 13_1_40CM_2_68_5]